MSENIVPTVPLKDGGEISITELIGKVVQFYHGNLRIGGVRKVTAQSLEILIQELGSRNLTVWIYPG